MNNEKLRDGMKVNFTNDLSKEIYEQTYKYGDEDIKDTLIRVAKSIASVEKDVDYWTEQFVSILDNFSFVPGGRIISNAGIPINGTTMINCFVDGFQGKNQDSIEGILDALRRQTLILKSEGGLGFCSDVIRPKGGYVSGIGNETPGSVKMLELWDTHSDVITAGSGKVSENKSSKKKIRKGAQMVTKSCWHPDIEEFITAKQTPGRLTKFNMSVLITDKFMDAVINHKPWDLIFPEFDDCDKWKELNLNGKDTYNNEWDNGNIEQWISKGYPVKIYKTYSDANELWDIIMKSTYSRNEPGVLFVDTINRLNNLKYCEYINSTNPCLIGSTLITTNKGQITIKELFDNYDNIKHDIKGLSYNLETNVLEFKDIDDVLLTKRNANVIELVFDDDNVIRLTPDHKVYTENRGWVEASKLTINDNILKVCD